MIYGRIIFDELSNWRVIFGSESKIFVKLGGKIFTVLCGPVDNKNGTNQWYKINCPEIPRQICTPKKIHHY